MPITTKVVSVQPTAGWEVLTVEFDGRGTWRMHRRPIAMWVVFEYKNSLTGQVVRAVTAIHTGNIKSIIPLDPPDLDWWEEGWWLDTHISVAVIREGEEITFEHEEMADALLEDQLEKNRQLMARVKEKSRA